MFTLRIGIACLLCVSFTASGDLSDPQEHRHPEGVLTLGEALSLALLQNPGLQAYAWEGRAAEARILQAGLRPNPEVSLEIEGIRWSPGPDTVSSTTSFGAGVDLSAAPAPGISPSLGYEREKEQGARSGFREAELTLSLSQWIELGGKRARRIRLAERGQELAQWDYEVMRATVIESTATAFVRVLSLQDRLALQVELSDLARQVLDTVARQVQAGAVSPIEEHRTKIMLDTTRIEQERAARELEAARASLAASWGDREVTFERVAGDLHDVQAIPPLDALLSGIADNPDLARWATEMAARDAAFDLEQARRVPDLSVTLGIRSAGMGSRTLTSQGINTDGSIGFSHTRQESGSSRDNSLVLGFSIPLPLFDRNQGNRLEAEYLIQKTNEERRATEVGLFATLTETYQQLSAAYDEIQILTHDILPVASETFEKTQEGYRMGKFDYVDVLDAERTLFDVRQQHLDALTGYHLCRVRLQRLTGLPAASGDSVLPETEKGDES